MNIEQKYQREFSILRENGQLIDDWSNVYEHCKLEGEIAIILVDRLAAIQQMKIPVDERDNLIKAAILHDWFKRVERETENYDSTLSYIGLIDLGVSKRVCDIAHSVGHSTLKECEGYDRMRKIMHFIDDIVANTIITEIVDRVESVRARGHLVKLEEEMKAELDGRSFFDVQIEVGQKIQKQIERMADIKEGTLVTWIQTKLNEQNNRL